MRSTNASSVLSCNPPFFTSVKQKSNLNRQMFATLIYFLKSASKWGQVQLDWLTGLSHLTLEMFSRVFFCTSPILIVCFIEFTSSKSEQFLSITWRAKFICAWGSIKFIYFHKEKEWNKSFHFFCVLIVVQVLTKWVILFSCYVLWFSFFKTFHFTPQML